ncbi:LysR family transcriptional regulator [Paraburkholderia sp.]|uniref:LysR family transcriptional regulator n=1 Tax=Paraburkholderia sp. TaxID=1926495 RepID=UPI00239BFD3D|nr:LysR family transcriptional regulator [Paraburkholderia sp.]MDE1180011.1 LysR family transcriptional regulator [Paraburkholderia sp.]
MNRLREIETFVGVVESGGFAAAADAEGVSRALTSRTVQELERRLGARLLHRTTRKVALTAAGEAYYHACRDILLQLDSADRLAQSERDHASGELRISAPVSFGIAHLAPLWPGLLERAPLVRPVITLSDALVDLVAEGFDLAIRIARPAESSLVHRRLASTPLYVCGSPDYLARYGTPQTPADLAAHQSVAYGYFSDKSDWRLLERATGVEHIGRPRPAMTANNGETCIAAAEAGIGLVLQPGFLVMPAIERGSLVPVLDAFAPPPIGIYAVYPSREQLPAKIRVAIDYLAGQWSDAPWTRLVGR